MRKNIIIIIFIIFITVITREVHAQQVSLAISPPLLELVIKPGKSIMIAYKIENFGDPAILSSKILPFEPKDNLGNIRLKKDFEGPIRFSLDNANLQLERPFFLKTGDSQQLLLKIRVPEGAPSGDYYYTLLVETAETNSFQGTSGTKAKVAIGSNILITVSENSIIDIKPKIVLFSTIGGIKIKQNLSLYDSFDKIPLVVILENKGKNLIKPEGKITLVGNFGEKINYQIIPKNILAESQRLIEASSSSQTIKNYQTSNQLTNKQAATITFSNFFLGLYNISTQISFGENSPTVFANTRFFAFPFKLFLGLLASFFITLLIVKNKSSNQ